MNLLTTKVLAGDKPEPPSLSEEQRVAFLGIRAWVTGVCQPCGHELVSLVGHWQMAESHRSLGVYLPLPSQTMERELFLDPQSTDDQIWGENELLKFQSS